MKTRHSFYISVLLLSAVGIFQSCYYDNEEYLYGAACDNSVITYTGRIKAIADVNCATTGCHAGPSPSDNISMEGYDNCKASTENVSVICAIKRDSGCSPMPKNRAQLSQCDIDAWQAWIDAGYPN